MTFYHKEDDGSLGFLAGRTQLDSELTFRSCNCLKALAHETRLGIIWLLRDGEKSVNELASSLGVLLPNISQHLRILRDREILVSRKQGNMVFYRLRDSRILKILETLQEIHCPQ